MWKGVSAAAPSPRGGAIHCSASCPSAEVPRQREPSGPPVCWSVDGFNFNVPDSIWEAVVSPELRDHVVCLRCFDDLAMAAGIDYQDHLEPELYFAGDRVALVLRIEGRARNSCR